MKLLEFFRGKRDETANIAKERLSVVIAHERNKRSDASGVKHAEYLPKLKKDVLDVIRKYVSIDDEDVTVRLEKSEDRDVLELNINLPDHAA